MKLDSVFESFIAVLFNNTIIDNTDSLSIRYKQKALIL